MPSGFQAFGSAEGYVGSAPFTPGTNAALWWRADLGITTVAGPKVSAWVDQVGGLSLDQGTDAKRPTYTASDAAYNNLPVVVTDATTFMATASHVLAQPMSIFIVGQNNTSAGTLLGTSTSAALDPIIFHSASLKGNAGATVEDLHTWTAPNVVLVVFNGASSFAGVSDWLTGGTTGNAGTNGALLFSIGAYSGGDFGAAGKIAEIVVLDHVVSAGEKTQLAAYFTARYGFAIT